MKDKICSLLICFTALMSYAQQDSQFTQYMYNTVNINPAYAGSRGVMSVFALHRNQWVGLSGAPETNAFALNTPLNNSKLGLGISFLNDKIGPANENTLSADVSYKIKATEKFDLSFGLKVTAGLFSVDFNQLNAYNQNDHLLRYNIENRFSPNFGAGLYLHSDKTYIGVSIPNILETKHFDKNLTEVSSSSVAKEKLHFYTIAGHVFNLSHAIKLKPALLTKLVPGAPAQLDISANVLFYDKFTLGAAYRWSAAVSALAGFQISDSWMIGYAYDMETTKLSNYNSGSHEIFLRFELFRNYDKLISPRFF